MSTFPYILKPNKYSSPSQGQHVTSVVIIVSIVISALIVRAIYTIFEFIKIVSDECIDGENGDYEEVKCAAIRTLLVVCVCAFLVVLIYTYMRRKYG